jgi:hypothetical protein
LQYGNSPQEGKFLITVLVGFAFLFLGFCGVGGATNVGRDTLWLFNIAMENHHF